MSSPVAPLIGRRFTQRGPLRSYRRVVAVSHEAPLERDHPAEPAGPGTPGRPRVAAGTPVVIVNDPTGAAPVWWLTREVFLAEWAPVKRGTMDTPDLEDTLTP